MTIKDYFMVQDWAGGDADTTFQDENTEEQMGKGEAGGQFMMQKKRERGGVWEHEREEAKLGLDEWAHTVQLKTNK